MAQPDLAARRVELQLRSSQLRTELAADAQVFGPALMTADHLRFGVYWVRQHPLWLGVAVVSLVVWRPSRLWRWGSKAWTVWRVWQRLQASWRRPLG